MSSLYTFSFSSSFALLPSHFRSSHVQKASQSTAKKTIPTIMREVERALMTPLKMAPAMVSRAPAAVPKWSGALYDGRPSATAVVVAALRQSVVSDSLRTPLVERSALAGTFSRALARSRGGGRAGGPEAEIARARRFKPPLNLTRASRSLFSSSRLRARRNAGCFLIAASSPSHRVDLFKLLVSPSLTTLAVTMMQLQLLVAHPWVKTFPG